MRAPRVPQPKARARGLQQHCTGPECCGECVSASRSGTKGHSGTSSKIVKI